MRLKTLFILLVVVSFSFASNVRSVLVIKATKSTLEADDLVTTMLAQGIDVANERIGKYQLIVMELPKDENASILTIASIKKEFPDAFRLYLPKAEEQINVEKIVTTLRKDREGVAIEYLKHIPQEDLPLWGTLFFLIIVLLITLIKAYIQRRSIFKLQDKLSLRQKEIEKSISQEKENIVAQKKSNKRGG